MVLDLKSADGRRHHVCTPGGIKAEYTRAFNARTADLHSPWRKKVLRQTYSLALNMSEPTLTEELEYTDLSQKSSVAKGNAVYVVHKPLPPFIGGCNGRA